MSETFKYLEKDNWGAENAAQQFMESRLAKNKYTQAQNEELMRNGGPAVVDAAEGVVPEGGAYDKYGPLKGNPEGTSETIGGSGGKLTETYGTLQDLGFDEARIEAIRKHAQGASGSNAFGYTSDTEHHFRETEDATSAGSIEADMRKIGKHMGYEHWGTANPERIRDYIMEQGIKKTKTTEATEGRKPIEHSPEVRQAKERVRAYEDGVMSGKTSDDIFGASAESSDAINARYTLDLNKGAAGIGTPRSGADLASKATGEFLASKTADVKNKYQFEAK